MLAQPGLLHVPIDQPLNRNVRFLSELGEELSPTCSPDDQSPLAHAASVL